jgi:endonuclease YncB( thermonuclease family)
MAQNDPWAAFSDAPAAAPVRSAQPAPVKPADPWGAFADAPGHGGKAGDSTPSVAALARSLINDRLTGSVIDGDTYNLQSGNHLRLYGADAPESKQMGLPRLGDPIPVGQRAADFARGLLAQQPTTIGGMVSASYGRPVAPVAAAGQDVAKALIRAGQALATPKYLAADPDRQFQYMQAERLARQNRLGLHGLAMQTPEDFRKNPLPLPKRETIPGFWDVPTPDAGLRPDVEKQVLDMVYRSDTPFEQIAAYGKQNGAIIDVASMKAARDYFRKYGAAGGIQYLKPPKVLTDNGDGTTGAMARGFANGFLPNLLEETGAAADTLGATSGRENVFNSDRRLADIWANNEAQNEAITGYDKQAHPYATTGAEIAGGLVVPMGKVRSAADLAKFGAGYGFASGFGREGTLPERLTSGVVGAGEGAAVTVLGGKALEAAAPLLAKGWRLVRGEKGPVLVPPVGEPVGGPDAGPAPRTPDRLEMPPAGPVAAPEPAQPINTAYPGPVPGKAPTLDDIKGQVDAWAARQGVGGSVMLHGSRKPDIQEFDPYQYADYGLFGQGTYLTDNAGVALGYTGKGLRGSDQSGRTLYAVEQSVKNPLDLDAPADPAKWAKLVEQYGLEIPPGATNEQAYKALEDAVAENMVPKWEGAEIMTDAVRSMGHDGLTHVGGGRGGGKDAPRHRVVIALDPEQTIIRDRLSVGDMLKPTMRDRSWIDIGQTAARGRGEAPRNLWDLPDTERNAILRDAEKVQEPLIFDHGTNDWRSETPAEKAARHAEIDRRYAADAVRSPASQGMAAEPMPSVSQDVPRSPDYLFAQRPGRVDAPRTDAQMRAADIQPGDVVPLPSNVVGSVEEAAAIDKGRYGPAMAPNERGELTRQTLRTWAGAEVPKTGPVDLVGWLRLNGGLKDQGGELAHMGLTNKGRAGMDFVGQETRFGPLVNSESGMNLDDAAQRAWDAGYFPDHTERPDVNTFLDAVRGTQEGWKRHYLPDDFAEIDRFNAARAERQDLARQRSEVGQVWRDKSVPADEPQPFAPPEAYEEWPGGGPDFAGNINLGKLDTPQDIRRALDQVNNRVGGFDEATRGRVAQAETERLASELGMTPDSLIARRKGQAFNAEEALAARQILAKSGNELVNAAKRIKATENPGDELLADFQRKLARHVAIQEQVSGMTAEAGRTLQQFRMVADSRNVRGDVLRSIVDAGGGGKRVQDAAAALLDVVEGEPGKFNVLAEKLTKPRWIDRAIELRYFMLLSGPQTHMSNVVSNTMTALGQFPEHAVAAGLGLGRRAVLGADKAADRVYSSEIGQRAFGFLQGIKEGGAQFLRTLRTGETSDFAGKMEAPMQPAFGGVAGKVIRSPMRMLSAEDEVFKAMARHMELAGLADRKASMEGLKGKAKADRIADLLNNPPDDMLEKAFDYARYITFQRPLTGIPESLSQLTQKHPMLKFIVPFVRTPTNLMKFAVERSPMAPLLKEWRADVVAGGARRDLALAKAMVGTGFGMWMADLARQGVITGSPPDDKNKERLLRADGWQPYSVKIGNKYVGYNRLDPFSSTISIAADLATKGDGMNERQLEQYPGLLVASIIKSMGDKTWLSGLSDFFEMASDPQRFAPRYLRNQAASSVIPAASAQLARTIDPVRRDSRSLPDELMARLPGLSQRLPAQTDIWGQPMTTQRLGPDLLSPVTTTERRNDPVNAAMLALGSTATAFPKFHMVNGKRVDYTPQEYATLSALAGQKAHDWIAALIKGRGWASKDAGTQAKLIKKSIDTARRDVRAGGGKGLFGRPSLPQAANDPWAAFSDAPVKVK